MRSCMSGVCGSGRIYRLVAGLRRYTHEHADIGVGKKGSRRLKNRLPLGFTAPGRSSPNFSPG